MRLHEISTATSMSDLDEQLQAYMTLDPIQFQKHYGMSKQQWYQRNKAVVGKLDQHHTHKGHTYRYHIPGEDTYLDRYETKHFTTDLEAEKYLARLKSTNPNCSMKKIN